MEVYRRNCISLLQYSLRNRGERLREANRETNSVYTTLLSTNHTTVAGLEKQNGNKDNTVYIDCINKNWCFAIPTNNLVTFR